ncbi:MAG: alpha/beta hydrolase [Dehalococcoidales bacterium]|nr:MAG: alpha/beta hydrolase [Dehalococcoidales bacterium]
MSRSLMIVVWIIVAVAIVYVLIGLYLFLFQSKFIYFPEVPGRTVLETPGNIGLAYENISLETANGEKIIGWFVTANNSRGVLLFCHGNAGNISHRLDSIRIFVELGLSVLIFDYRGYGESEGKPSESGTYQDAEAAWNYLVKERHINPEKIIIFGRSLGGGIASYIASRFSPGMLILESTFTSLPDIAASHFPYFPIKLITKIKYPTAEYLSRVNCPVLIIHSRDDEEIPFSHGQNLYEIAADPKVFLTIQGSHNQGFIDSSSSYEEGLDMFISKYLKIE